MSFCFCPIQPLAPGSTFKNNDPRIVAPVRPKPNPFLVCWCDVVDEAQMVYTSPLRTFYLLSLYQTVDHDARQLLAKNVCEEASVSRSARAAMDEFVSTNLACIIPSLALPLSCQSSSKSSAVRGFIARLSPPSNRTAVNIYPFPPPPLRPPLLLSRRLLLTFWWTAPYAAKAYTPFDGRGRCCSINPPIAQPSRPRGRARP